MTASAHLIDPSRWKQIASAGMDGRINLWDAVAGELQVTLHEEGSGTESVAFTPDGQFILTASNALRTYTARLDDLIALATSRLTRMWTLEECQKYLRMNTCPSDP